MSTRAAAVNNKQHFMNNTTAVTAVNSAGSSSVKNVAVRSKKTNNFSSRNNNNSNKSNNNNNNSKKNKKLLSEQQHQQQHQQQQQKQKQATAQNHNKRVSASAPNTPQQRRTVLPVKARRVERRKEIVSITEALKVELEASAESDDSDGAVSSSTRPHSHHFTTSKDNHSPKIRFRRRSSSAVQLRSTTYAGPTFNNSPAPSALPIPSFSPATTPTLISATPSSSSSSSIGSHEVSLEQQSKDLLHLLSCPPQKEEVVLARDLETDYTLSEIQRGLRSMLRI
ncbi:hypothetical protein K501DRAFT_333932 [Backusella circina FSU 941]|nr:hypothetical protein K501DRAFT_333932 [Backusella circina FSU 941]